MNRRDALKALVQTAAGVAVGVRLGVDQHTLLSSDRVAPEEWGDVLDNPYLTDDYRALLRARRDATAGDLVAAVEANIDATWWATPSTPALFRPSPGA